MVSQRNWWVRIGKISVGLLYVWLTERSRELIPETKGSILEGTICYSYRRWCGWTSVTKAEERVLRGSWTVMRLCRYGSVVVRTLQVSDRSLFCAQLSLTSAETEGRDRCDWIWELWQPNVQQSSGSVGAGWSETWAGCDRVAVG